MTPEENTTPPIPGVSKNLDRWPYFFWGVGLMIVKYNLDRAIAIWGFHRSWFFWNYIKPGGASSISAVAPDDRRFYYILLLTSLPFLAAGIVLTVRRLRSAALPMALCLLFFVPVLNLIFFVVLGIVPSRRERDSSPISRDWLSWMPNSGVGSAIASTVIVGAIGIGLAVFSTDGLGSYGWGLFIGLPFAMGMLSVLIYCGPEKRSLESCILVSQLSVLFAGFGLFGMAVEGAVCLVMAAPIAMAMALFGGGIAYLIVDHNTRRIGSSSMCVVLAAVPLTMGFEKQAAESAPVLAVTSSVIINAVPEKVWPNVVSFSEIPEKRDFIFHTGLAYPLRSRIEGQGVGAIRHCIFTTGEFIEPIEVWDPPHLLRFSVARQPEPMEELSPYPQIHPAHLHGYFSSHEGELRLTALAGGRTLLEGSTWYTDQIWPAGYWKLWSDYLIHRIHLRVLNHIKAASEGGIDG